MQTVETTTSSRNSTNAVLVAVQSIYDAHKLKLNNLKENRSKSDEENWTDAEIKSVDDQITILASVLSDLYRNVLQCSVSGSFFKEIVIMKADGVVLKTLQTIDHIPRTNNFIYVDDKRYQVTSNVFNYDLKCINVWVVDA